MYTLSDEGVNFVVVIVAVIAIVVPAPDAISLLGTHLVGRIILLL